MIASVAVTGENVGDSTMLAPLVTETAENFNVERVSADKAYASVFNFNLIESLGATPFVAFKTSHNGTSKSATWNRLYHFFHFQKDEFLKHYHQRSNVESTFSSIKRKFGAILRSKTPVAQQNEALLKVLCHNLVCLIHEIHQSGATAMFPAFSQASVRPIEHQEA